VKQDIAEAARRVREAALELRAALFAADRIWRRGGLTPDERREMNEANREAERAAIR
jgi:hypothetical protein